MANDTENKKVSDNKEESKVSSILKKVLGGLLKGAKMLGSADYAAKVMAEDSQKRQNKLNEKFAAENEKFVAERREEIRKDIAEKLANPVSDCPHGKCVYCSDKFYFTCSKSQACDKGLKKKHLNELSEADDPRLIDYAIITASYKEVDERVFNMLESNKGKEYVMSDICKDELLLTDEAFINEYYPNLSATYAVAPLRCLMDSNSKWRRDLFKYINLSYVSTKDDNSRFSAFGMIPGFTPVASNVLMKCFSNIEKGQKPEILTISDDDFYYFIEVLMLFFCDLEVASTYCSIDKISESILFDESGKLKRVGYGGEAVGETGDTIWNSVLTFEKENITDADIYEKAREDYKSLASQIRKAAEEWKCV